MTKPIYVCEECGTHWDTSDEVVECCPSEVYTCPECYDWYYDIRDASACCEPEPEVAYKCDNCDLVYKTVIDAFCCCKEPQVKYECEECGASHEDEETAEHCFCKEQGSYCTGDMK